MFELFSPSEIVLVGRRDDELLMHMIQELHGVFKPNVVSLVFYKDEGHDKLINLSPFLKDYEMVQGRGTAYICKHTCQPQ